MVLYVIKWNISPKVTVEDYDAFTKRRGILPSGSPRIRKRANTFSYCKDSAPVLQEGQTPYKPLRQ